MRLIVTEKPSVARDIARVLGVEAKGQGFLEGKNLRITWCLGHLVCLAEPEAYDPAWKPWRLERLPMLPERFELQPATQSDRGRNDQWRVVSEQLRDAELTEVINGCDAGREGELIFAYAYQLSGCTAPVRRLWVNALTDQAIRQGFDRLRPGVELAPLEDAARCRSEADWLVGLNATRAMTMRNRNAGGDALLSVGRVQTPTLALICTRDTAIARFVVKLFWTVKLTFEAPAGQWEATWRKGKTERFETAEAAREVLARVAEQPGEVVTADHKKKPEAPPLLYDLTTLQRESNKRFGFSAQQTLDLAQSLYERHKLLTYPRTDSRHLSSQQTSELPVVLTALAFGPYAACAAEITAAWPPKFTRRLVDDAEVRDHHAIIPTASSPANARLNVDEKRIYDLVARRFLAAFLPDAMFATTNLETRVGQDLFVARGRTMLAAGWQAIDPPLSKKKELQLPAVEVGVVVPQIGQELHEGKTKPPTHYTEASLLGAMERAGEGLEEEELRRAMKGQGLGTPATRASIIETLIKRGYIEREKKHLLATTRGQALVQAIPVAELCSPQLTGNWEARLSSMAEGKQARGEFMADIRKFTAQLVAQIRQTAAAEPIQGDGPRGPEPERLGDCPACGTPVGRRGTVYTCKKGRACPFVVFGETSGVEIPEKAVRQLLADGESALLKGFTTREGTVYDGVLRWNGKRVQPVRVDPRSRTDSPGTCPGCGRQISFERDHWRCTGCALRIAGQIMERPVRATEVAQLLTHGRTARLYGFRQKGGAFCKAALVLDAGGQVTVDFNRPENEPARELPAGSPAPAFGRITDCPLCLLRGSLDPGYVIAGKLAWGCAAWQQGCSLQVPFDLAGRKMSDDEIARLFGKQRTTRYLKGFNARDGLPRREACRVVIALDAEQGWELEEKQKR